MLRIVARGLLIAALLISIADAQSTAIQTSQIKLTTMVRCEADVEGKAYEWRVFGPRGKVATFRQENGAVCSFEPAILGMYNIVSVIEGVNGKVYMTDATYQLGPAPRPDPSPGPGPGPVPDPDPDPDPMVRSETLTTGLRFWRRSTRD